MDKNILKFADELELGKQEKPAPSARFPSNWKNRNRSLNRLPLLPANRWMLRLPHQRHQHRFRREFSKLGVKTIRDLLYFSPPSC